MPGRGDPPGNPAASEGRGTGRDTRPRRVVLLVLVALLAGCTAPAPPRPPEGDPVRQLVVEVSGTGAVPHLEALQRIADANDENRASPGSGYEASVDYVAGVLREAGYDISLPTYPVVVDERGGERHEVVLRQVIAQTRTGDPRKVVMAGAHLDSVPGGPGINDNASGVAALLEIATRLGGSPQVANAVRFAFWGSEEDELTGSTFYVKSLSGPDRDRIVLYLNADMVASPNAGYFVQGGVGRRPSQTGPPGSAEVVRELTDQLGSTGVVADLIPFDGESDYEPFVAAGIPAGSVFAGDDADKSPHEAQSWGGQAGEAYDRCYHQACDRIENLNRTALNRFTRAVAGTLVHFATVTDPLPS